MRALVISFGTADEAGAEALGLNGQGWNTLVTGPVDGLRVLQGDQFVAEYAGSWIVLASREEIQQP